MTRKNKYFVRSHLSEKKFREIIKLFSADLTASQIAFLTQTNRNTINKILKNIRIRIAEICEKESPFEKGEIEMDESYFRARKIRGKKGRGNVYTQVIRNCSKTEILPLISSKISKRTTVFTDGCKTYDSLMDLGYKKHYRVHHGKNEFVKKKESKESCQWN